MDGNELKEAIEAVKTYALPNFLANSIYTRSDILLAKIFHQYQRFNTDANVYLFVEHMTGDIKKVYPAPKPFLYEDYFHYLLGFFTKHKINTTNIKLRISTGFYNDYPSWSTLEDTFFLLVLDIDDINEAECKQAIEVFNKYKYTPTYVVKTTKGYHFLWLCEKYIMKEEGVLFATFKMFLSTFFNQIKLIFEKELPFIHFDKIMPLEGFYTRADGIVVYEGKWYASFWDIYKLVIPQATEGIDNELVKILNNEVDLENDYSTTLYYMFYDIEAIKNYTLTICPILHKSLTHWEEHTYTEWKIVVWFYYLLYKFFAKDEKERQKVFEELLEKASSYRKETPHKAKRLTKQFFDWFVEKNFPFLFWSCKRFNKEFGCPVECSNFNKSVLPIVPVFVLPSNFEVVDKKYFYKAPVKSDKDSGIVEYKYVCRFFYPVWVATDKIENEKIAKSKIVVAGSNKIDEFIVKIHYDKGYTEAEMLLIADKKRYKELLSFFNQHIINIIEPDMIGIKQYTDPIPLIRLRNFITANLEDHPFSNFYTESYGSYTVFKKTINKILYEVPDDCLVFKLMCWLALFSIFYLRRYMLFGMNSIFILIGSTGSGKTSALKLYNSFFRNPNHFFTLHADDITNAYINRRLPFIRTSFVGDDFIVNDKKDVNYMKQLIHDLANRRISKANMFFSRATEIIIPCLFSMETKYYTSLMAIEGVWRRMITFNTGYRHPSIINRVEDIQRTIVPIFMEHWGWGWELYNELLLSKEEELAKKLLNGEYKNVDYAVFDFDPMLKFLFSLKFILNVLYPPERANFYFSQILHLLVAPHFKELNNQESCLFDMTIDFITFSDMINTIKHQGDQNIDSVIALEKTVTYNRELYLYYNFFTKILRTDWLAMPNLNPFWLVLIKNNPIKFILQDPYHKETVHNFIQQYPNEFNKFLLYLKMYGYDFSEVLKKELQYDFCQLSDEELNKITESWQ